MKWALAGMAIAAASANAQQYIVYEGTVVQPAPVVQYAPAPVVHALPAAPCCGTATFVADAHPAQSYAVPGCDDCVCTHLPFTMQCNGKCKPTCVEEPIPVKPGGPLPTLPCPPSRFYCNEIPFEHIANTPHIQEKCSETIHFKEHKEEKECCWITTCIPCKRVTCTSKECVLAKAKVNFIAKKRTSNGCWDVYAINVPGMPSEFLWKKNVSWYEVLQHFPTPTQPLPPQDPPCK